jgi:hypothetical protein
VFNLLPGQGLGFTGSSAIAFGLATGWGIDGESLETGVAFYDRLPFRLSGHNSEITYYLYFMERIVFKL